MELKDKEIALMYSGGLDTTYVATQLPRQFDKVHLLTFCNGFCIRVNSSKKHVCLLRERYGKDKFEHRIVSVSGILSFLRKDLFRDMIKARSPLLFDLCCRLSMETATVIYCLEHGIRFVTDGNNSRTQGEIFLQQEKYLKKTAGFFSRYGICYIHPCDDLASRDAITKELRASGIRTGIGALRKVGITTQLFTQPFCLWAIVAFIFTSWLRKLPFVGYFTLSTEEAIAIRSKKEKLADNIINHFKLNSSLSRLYPCKKQTLFGIFGSVKKC